MRLVNPAVLLAMMALACNDMRDDAIVSSGAQGEDGSSAPGSTTSGGVGEGSDPDASGDETTNAAPGTSASGTHASTTDADESTTAVDPTLASSPTEGDGGGYDTGTGGADFCGCEAGTELVYLFSDTGELWSFDPITYDFTSITALGCAGGQPISMAIARNGDAWIEIDGDLWVIDLDDPDTCIDPGYQAAAIDHPGSCKVFGQCDSFGMGFVSIAADDPCDELYAISLFDNDLMVMDAATLTMSSIADTDIVLAEVVGTGDGRMFVFGDIPLTLYELDKSDGSIISSTVMTDLGPGGGALDFAFYGGDFYFFTEVLDGPPITQVTRMDFDDSDGDGEQQLELVVPVAPLLVVGAGTSTCVPIGPPV